MKRHFRFIFGWTVFLWIVQNTFGQTSAHYTLKNSVMDQGGGVCSSAHYQVTDAIGQPFPIGVSTSTRYHESSGFLAGGGIVSGVSENISEEIPKAFELLQNYPNPFNPETSIRFDLPVSGDVEFMVYDLSGRVVYHVQEQGKSPGSYEIRWNGQDQNHAALSSGVYLYRIEVRGRDGHFQDVKKMIFMK